MENGSSSRNSLAKRESKAIAMFDDWKTAQKATKSWRILDGQFHKPNWK